MSDSSESRNKKPLLACLLARSPRSFPVLHLELSLGTGDGEERDTNGKKRVSEARRQKLKMSVREYTRERRKSGFIRSLCDMKNSLLLGQSAACRMH